MQRNPHAERHLLGRIGWLRAGVLGANDGIVSTASLLVGVAAAGRTSGELLVTGLASLVAGAMSMAAGEYVSVSSQSDTEKADLAREAHELDADPEAEKRELAGIYVARGLDSLLARQVAEQLTAKDALKAHARDELGIVDITVARPVQAAFTSALTFASGAFLPLLSAILAPDSAKVGVVSLTSLFALALLGVLGAWAGKANLVRPTVRVVLWGAAALAVTAGIGALVGAAV